MTMNRHRKDGMMKIETMDVAYVFPNIKSLKKFVEMNYDKIDYPESMLDIRVGNDDVCFIFGDQVNGKYNWDVHTIWYTKKYYDVEIKTYSTQRSE